MFRRPFARSSARVRQGGAVLLLACGLALPGCGRTQPVAPEVQTQPWEGKPTRVLEADVGLVRPGQKVSRRFTITNDSRNTWTLARLHNDCACTAGQPRTEAEVHVGAVRHERTYHRGASEKRDAQHKPGFQFWRTTAQFHDSGLISWAYRLLFPRPGGVT